MTQPGKTSVLQSIAKDFSKNKPIYLMALPVFLYYAIFCYAPMYGVIIAFKNFAPGRGILGSNWVGLQHFRDFFGGVYFTRILSNTLAISLLDLVFNFPAALILALMLNELRQLKFKKLVQTVSYLPHFISIMVICGMIIDMCSTSGLVNTIIEFFGGERSNLLINPNYFRPIYIITNVWQGIGWGSIIYLSALAGIDQELYQAAALDGAGKIKQLIHVTLPGIMSTVIILLILRIGQIMNVGFEKIILLYNQNTYSTADVISSFVYRKGLLESNYSYSAAVGLFNSVINFALIVSANKISRKLTETSLW